MAEHEGALCVQRFDRLCEETSLTVGGPQLKAWSRAMSKAWAVEAYDPVILRSVDCSTDRHVLKQRAVAVEYNKGHAVPWTPFDIMQPHVVYF